MKRALLLFFEISLLVALGTWVVMSLATKVPMKPGGVEVIVQLAGAQDKAVLYHNPDGAYRFTIFLDNGQPIDISPEELASRMHRDRTSRSWGQTVLNVSSPLGYLWVGLGFLGQVLFTGRMIVQWLASEKNKRSVVPPMFWWMSLVGSTMLMVYFLWRRDPIGLLGQTFGWFIYIRNLWMIYRPANAANGGAVVDAEG